MFHYFALSLCLIFFITSGYANQLETEDTSLEASNTLIPGKIFHDRLQDGSLGPEMLVIPAGQFRMGNLQNGGHPDEQPVHTVFIKRFALGRSEVTFADYDRFAKATRRKKPDDKGWGRGNRPVIFVSYEDAIAYARWLSQQTGQQYRLPTEAEWEYAAKAGTETKYWWGNQIGKNRAACHKCQSQWGYEAPNEMPAPVCSFPANDFGLCDTVGNVWEWTCSQYDKKYRGKELYCVLNKTKRNEHRVIRGGSWFDQPSQVRATQRGFNRLDYRRAFVGFRLWRRVAR